jgi:hypothetical protein
MGKKTIAVTAALCAAVFIHPSPTDACIHAAGAGGEPVEISQKGHQGLIIWHDGKEEMVLKLEYESGADVSALGLVIPVPAVPEAYATAEASLFETLHSWVRLERQRPAVRSASGGLRSRNGHGPSGPSLVALPAAEAGPYRIQPLQAFGEEGITALTEWMEENEFAPIPREVLTYYTERHWTFLTVKVDPAEGESLARRGGLPPLRARFATDRAIYPLKLEAQGTFPLRLYLVTREPLPDDAFDGAVERGFEVAGAGTMRPLGARGAPLDASVGRFAASSAPAPLRSILEDLDGMDEGELTVRVLFNRRFGHGAGNSLAWPEELSFPGVAEGERLMGTAVQPAAAPETETETETETEAETETETETETEAETAAETETEDDGGLCAASGRAPSPALGLVVTVALLAARRRRHSAR